MKFIKSILTISAIGSLAIFLLVVVLRSFGLFVYFLEKLPLDPVFLFILLVIGFGWLRAIFEMKRNSKIISLILLILGTIIMTPFVFFVRDNERWTEYASPSGEHTLVIRDRSFLLGGSSEYYETVNEWLIKDFSGETDHIMSCDDGCMPSVISATWSDEHTLVFTYEGGFSSLQTVRFVFSEN